MVPYYIRMTGFDTTGVSRRALKEITRAAHRLMASEWHRQFIARHFQQPARFRYGFKPRSADYLKGKLKQGKGNVDLVSSGLTEEAMQRPPLISAFPSRATIRMAGPSYVAMRPRFRNAPNMGAEITTIVGDEIEALERGSGQCVAAGLNLCLDALQSVSITVGSWG